MMDEHYAPALDVEAIEVEVEIEVDEAEEIDWVGPAEEAGQAPDGGAYIGHQASTDIHGKPPDIPA